MNPAETFPARLSEALGDETAYAFSKRTGLDQSLLSKYIRGDSLPRVDRAAEIAAAAGVSLDWLMGADLPSGDGALVEASMSGIPILGEIPAGPLTERYVAEHVEEYAPIDTAAAIRGEQLFGLRVTGYSMFPYMMPGDVAVCSAVASVNVGDDVAVWIEDRHESTIKRLTAKDPKRRRVQLTPLNPEEVSFRVDLSSEDRICKVRYLWRDVSRRSSIRPS